MKLARFLGLAVILTGVFFTVLADGADPTGSNTDTTKEPRYVFVKKPSVVYTKLDPKSEIIRMVKKGEYLELLRKGENGSWYEVKVDGRIGYLETKTGTVVDSQSGKLITLLLFILILVGAAGGVLFYMKRQQLAPPSSSANSIDNDLDDLD